MTVDVIGGDAGAHDWARLDDAGRRILLTAILAQVSRDALRGQGLEAVLSAIVGCLVARLPVAVASIILLDAGGRNFVHEVSAGAFELSLPSAFPWPVSIGAAGRCARTGQPVLISDVRADPDYVPGHPSVRSEYIVPIRHGGRMHGVLNLESTRDDLFTREFCAVFDAIAEQVAGAIHLARVERELVEARRRVEDLSTHDALTGIGNRMRFEQVLARCWDATGRVEPVAVMYVDIDGFAGLSEACGRFYGEECLRELARQCQALVQGGDDLAARLEGDRMAVVLPGRDAVSARRSAERLRAQVAAVRMNNPAAGQAGHVTVSIGVGVGVPSAVAPPACLVRLAERALRTAVGAGGNRVVVMEA